MDPSEALRPVKGGVEVDIIVTPNAKADQVGKVDQWRKRLAVKVTALPTDGRANRAVEDLLTEYFGAKVEIVRGHTDRQKSVFVPLSLKEARARMEGA